MSNAEAVEAVVGVSLPLGHDIDFLFSIREKKRKLEAMVKEIGSQQAELEQKVLLRLREEGLDKASGRRATAFLDKKHLPDVIDWDAFVAYMRHENAFHLMQHRVNAAAWNELCEKRKAPPPGTQLFIKESLALRVIS